MLDGRGQRVVSEGKDRYIPPAGRHTSQMSSFCPIPHTFRDQLWLSVGVGLGLGLARYLRGLGRRSLSSRSRMTTLYYWPATGKAETIRMLLAEGGVPFEESNFEKPDGVPIYAAGGEGMKAARTSAAAAAFFTACRSHRASPVWTMCSLLGLTD